MDSRNEFRRGRIGSLELNARVGPNLLRGLLAATLIHGGVIATPTILREFFGIWTLPPVEVETESPGEVTIVLPPMNFDHVRPQPPAPKPAKPEFAIPVPVAFAPDTSLLPDQEAIKAAYAPEPTIFDDSGTGTSIGGVEDLVNQIADLIPEPGVWIAHEEEPHPLSTNAQPDYPELAKAGRLKGTVRVQLYVDVKGDVRRFHIVKADPRDVGFEDEVLKVIPRWKFTPALQQQRPVGVWVTIPVKFEIK